MTPAPRALTEDQIRERIADFFGWYRQRHTNASALATFVAKPVRPEWRVTFQPDQHVLIGSGLDALAGAWARVFRPDLRGRPHNDTPNGVRFSEFLRANANGSRLFDKVAGPMLVDEVARSRPDLEDAVRRIVLDTDRGGVVRFADDDSDHATVEAAFLAHRDLQQLPKVRRLVQRFQFGEVLYSEHRCLWLHTLAPSQKLAPSEWDVDRKPDTRIRYMNFGIVPEPVRLAEGVAHEHQPVPHLLVKTRRPIFSVSWLLAIYEEAINSFERQCSEGPTDPMPYDEDAAE